VLEAMAAGVVPIVVKYGGPGELVVPDCGFLLKMAERDVIVRNLHEVLDKIVAAPEQLAALSQRGVERAFGEFSWPAKAQRMVEVYRWVLGQRADRPESAVQLQLAQ